MEGLEPRVIILDAGAQYVDLIHKAVERHGFPARILPLNTPLKSLPKSTEAIIVSGGPRSTHHADAPMPDQNIWEQDTVPTFNICYGMQAFARAHGGVVSTRPYRNDSRITTEVTTTHPLFTGVRTQTQALFTHGDFVDSVGPNVTIIGEHRAANGDHVISALTRGPHVAVQFHPEVTDDTPQGFEIFSNFFTHIAHMTPEPSYLKNRMQAYIAAKHRMINQRVGTKHVIAFVSGGVDSVTAVMLARAVVPPERLHMYYIDNGFMRDEDDTVIESLQAIGLDVQIIHAEDTFARAHCTIDGVRVGPLETTTNPVHKHRIIGETFVDIQDEIVATLGLKQADVVLLQGTNAADRIESGFSKGGGVTDQIKEHHNQVQRVKDLHPLEPIDDLFKEEIRQLAVALGLPDTIAYRQPFPGPGTAIRILGLSRDSTLAHSEKNQRTISAALRNINRESKSDLAAQLLPVRSVGVGGDARSHIQAVALQGSCRPQDLRPLAHILTSEFPQLVNRVIYTIAGPDIHAIQSIETYLTPDARQTVRKADAIAMETARQMDLMRDIEQFPVVLLPIGTDGKRSIVLRPLFTRAHLTVQALIPGVDLPQKFFDTIAQRIINEVDGISHVFADLTNKPPATTEWE